jgi:CBS domain-containing protein
MTSTPTFPAERSLEALSVSDAMTTGLICCTPDTPLRAVAHLMAARRVHAVYVFDYGFEDDETSQLWGLVSDIDLVAAARADIDERTAGDSAVTPLVSVRSDESLDRAAQLMAENGVSHLAVIDPTTRRPVAVLSSLDIACVVAEPGEG